MTVCERMDHKLRIRRGHDCYQRRSTCIKSMFGQMKDRQNGRRFSMRELDRCCGERNLKPTKHNMIKLHRDSVRRVERTKQQIPKEKNRAG